MSPKVKPFSREKTYSRAFFTALVKDERGSITAFFVLFLPIAILCIGMVIDLGLIFTAQKCVQSACDLGALGGLQELDWQALAEGRIVIKEEEARGKTKEIIEENLKQVLHLVNSINIRISVQNAPFVGEPGIAVDVDFTADTFFLKWLTNLGEGLPIRVHSQASIVERKKW